MTLTVLLDNDNTIVILFSLCHCPFVALSIRIWLEEEGKEEDAIGGRINGGEDNA